MDGTYPLRCVLRCLMSMNDQIWERPQTSQHATLPKCLWITHVIIYATHPCLTSSESYFTEAQRWIPKDVLPTMTEVKDGRLTSMPLSLMSFLYPETGGGAAMPEAVQNRIQEERRRGDPDGTKKEVPICARSPHPGEGALQRRSALGYFARKTFIQMLQEGRKPRGRIGVLDLTNRPNLVQYLAIKEDRDIWRQSLTEMHTEHDVDGVRAQKNDRLDESSDLTRT